MSDWRYMGERLSKEAAENTIPNTLEEATSIHFVHLCLNIFLATSTFSCHSGVRVFVCDSKCTSDAAGW
jgi:hypothetical protein